MYDARTSVPGGVRPCERCGHSIRASASQEEPSTSWSASSQRVDNEFLLLRGEARRIGYIKTACVDISGDRCLTWIVSEGAIWGLIIDHREEGAGFNPGGLKSGQRTVPKGNATEQHVIGEWRRPGVRALRREALNQVSQVGERCAQLGCIRPSAFDIALDFLQLHMTDGSVEVAHLIVASEKRMHEMLAPSLPEVPDRCHPAGKRLVSCNDYSAFA